MRYKGYEGVVEFDDEANIFHGEVINIRDVVTFQGTTVEEINFTRSSLSKQSERAKALIHGLKSGSRQKY